MSALVDLYRRERRSDRYVPASVALAVARMRLAAEGFWNAQTHGNEVEAAESREGGYQYRAVVECDQDPDRSFLGEFTDDPDGAIPNDQGGHGDYAYFRPENPGIDNLPWFRRAGMSKADALARCAELDRSEMELARSDDWYGVTVTCSVGGRVLGESSLWGMSDDDYRLPYVASEAREVAAEARHEADAAIARMLGTVAEVIA